MNHWEAFDGLREVHEELLCARFALGHTIRSVEMDITLLAQIEHPLTPSHLRGCAARLELTYLLRLFAEFEAVLRDYWASVRPRPAPRRTKAEVLIRRVSIECQIPFDVAQDAHEVREYRNNLAHRHELNAFMPFHECKSRLGTFLSYLPRTW